MSCDPLSSMAREMLIEAASRAKGLPLKGRAEKQAARALVARGFAELNKSASRVTLNAAGQFIVKQWQDMDERGAA